MGHYQRHRHGQRTPGHDAPFQIDAPFTEPVQQQAAEEGIQEPADADIYLIRRQSETADDGVSGIFTYGQQPRDVKVHGEVYGQKGREEDEHGKDKGIACDVISISRY